MTKMSPGETILSLRKGLLSWDIEDLQELYRSEYKYSKGPWVGMIACELMDKLSEEQFIEFMDTLHHD